MSKQKDKKSGKEFELTPHSSISASAASGGTINGQVARFVGVENIPFRLKQGDQSFYFDVTKVETSSIVRTDDGVVYVPYKKKNWQDMLIGNNSDAKSRFSDTAYQQISSAFASKISNIDGDFLLTQVVEENYTSSAGPGGSFVGPVTASYEIRTSNGITQSYSGIDDGLSLNSGVEFLIENNSTFATHTSFLVGIGVGGGTTAELTQSIFFTSSLIAFDGNQLAGRFAYTLNPSQFSSPASGSALGMGIVVNVNNSNANDGSYVFNAIKGRIAGDADSGSLYSFLETREIIIYSSSVVVNSGSFQYSPTSEAAATGSGVFKTLYYISGSTGPSGSYTGSCVLNTAPLGSPLHGDASLRTTASYGYYHVPGTDGTVFLASSSAIDNAGNTVQSQKVPRWVRKFNL